MTYLPEPIAMSRCRNAPPPPRLRATWLVHGGLIAAAALVVVIVGGRLELGGPLLPDSGLTVAVAWMGLAPVFAAPLIGRTRAQVEGTGMLLGTLLGLLAFLPLVAWLAFQLVVHPIVHAARCLYCDFHHDGDWLVLFGGPVASAALAAGVASVVEVARTRWGIHHVRRTAMGFALCAAAASLVLIGMGSVATYRRPNPTWSSYVAGVPLLADLPEPPSEDSSAIPPPPWSQKQSAPARHAASAGDVGILAWGNKFDVCFQLLRDSPVRDAAPASASVNRLVKWVQDDDRGRLILRRDSSRDLLFVETAHGPTGRVGTMSTTRLAFRNSTLRKVDVTPLDFVRDCGPPAAWLAAAAFGLLLAILSVGWRSRTMRQISDRHAWRAGTCNEAGSVTLEDGTTLPALRGIPEGPVVVILKPATATGPYRDAGAAIELAVPGTPDQLESRMEAAIAVRWAFALSAMVLSSTPLAVAGIMGFLW